MVRHLENARTCIEGNYYSIVIESDIGFAVEGIENKRDLPSRALRTIVRFVTETRVLSVTKFWRRPPRRFWTRIQRQFRIGEGWHRHCY